MAAAVCVGLLAGCGSAQGPMPTQAPSATTFTPSATAVTVPQLPAASASGSAEPYVTAESVSPTSGKLATATTFVETLPTGSQTPIRPHPPSQTRPTPPTPAEKSPPATPATPAAPTTPAAPKPVTVDLSRCSGCAVLAVHADVAGRLSAALARAPNGAVLLSADSDGGIAGVINVPYGGTFPAPAGGILPCDTSGRCFVVARGGGGKAVVAVFVMAADGSWRDVTPSGGIRSATAVGAAVDLTGDGLLDVAVQAAGAAGTVWRVQVWSGDGFTLLGCTRATTGTPPPSSQVPYSVQQCN